MSERLAPQLLPRITPDMVPGLALDMARSGLALMLYGAPGIGKTSIFQGLGRDPGLLAWAESQSGYSRPELPVVTLSAPELNVEDLMGVPTVEELVRSKLDGTKTSHKVTRWALPIQLDPHQPFVLFIDEPNRCEAGVRNALFQLITGRTTSGGFTLPPGSFVCMAGNRIEDRAGVRILDTAFNNRCGHFELVIEMESWLSWAGNQPGFSGLVKAFITAHPQYLHRFDSASPYPQQATPRTWGALGMALGQRVPEDSLLAHGLVGAEAAQLFHAFGKHASIIPSLKELAEAPEKVVIPNSGQLDAAWIMATSLSEHLVAPKKGKDDRIGRAVGVVLGRMADQGFEEVSVFSLRRAHRLCTRGNANLGLSPDSRFPDAVKALGKRPGFIALLEKLEQIKP